MKSPWFVLLVWAALTLPRAAATDTPKWHPGHHILVGGGEIRDDLLALPRFRDFQKMYGWKQLEPQRGRYDFSSIRRDLERLALDLLTEPDLATDPAGGLDPRPPMRLHLPR